MARNRIRSSLRVTLARFCRASPINGGRRFRSSRTLLKERTIRTGGRLKATSTLVSNAALRSSKPLKSVKRRITGRSKKAVDFENEYLRVRPKVLERAENRCEVRMLCHGAPATHVHHAVVGRSHGGSNDMRKLFACCAPCHSWIHGHAAAARKLGFLH